MYCITWYQGRSLSVIGDGHAVMAVYSMLSASIFSVCNISVVHTVTGVKCDPERGLRPYHELEYEDSLSEGNR